MINLICGDCLKVMKELPDSSVNLVLTDPPYNIGVKTQCANKVTVNGWDKIDDYINWCISWLHECSRVLKPNGVLYMWHNDMAQIAELMEAIKSRTDFVYISFCIWDKGDTYRARSWLNRDTDSATALRSWFSICEYCLHFFNAPKDGDRAWAHTGLDRINSNPECYKPLKEWYAAEMARLGLTKADIAQKYTEATGKKPFMLRHYFKDSQFTIPTREVWESVYMPLGFGKEHDESRKDFDTLRSEYEALRCDYEALRNTHNCDARHCNVWHIPPLPSTGRLHTCQKPLELMERLIRVSSNEGDVVLDPFMGSGTTGVACLRTNRNFIGIEMNEIYFGRAKERIEAEGA